MILPVHDHAGTGDLAPPAAPLPADAEACRRSTARCSIHRSATDGCYVLGRIAQSLDGRIATASGASHWISGHEDIVHTHRLRALFDAVVVGAGTVRADDPQLTTRECRRAVAGARGAGYRPQTGRAVSRVPRRTGKRCCCVPLDAAGEDCVGQAPVLRLPRAREGLDIAAVLRGAGGTRAAARVRRRRRHHGVALPCRRSAGSAARDHRAAADRLGHSRLHPAAKLRRLTEGLRFDWSVHRVGADLLVDIPLSRARPGNHA